MLEENLSVMIDIKMICKQKNGQRNANDGEIAKNLYQQGHKHKHQGRNIQHHGSPTNHLRRRNMEHEKKPDEHMNR